MDLANIGAGRDMGACFILLRPQRPPVGTFTLFTDIRGEILSYNVYLPGSVLRIFLKFKGNLQVGI